MSLSTHPLFRKATDHEIEAINLDSSIKQDDDSYRILVNEGNAVQKAQYRLLAKEDSVWYAATSTSSSKRNS